MNLNGITVGMMELPSLEIKYTNVNRGGEEYSNPVYKHGHLYEIKLPMLIDRGECIFIYAMPEVFCFNRDSGNMRMLFHAFSMRCCELHGNGKWVEKNRVPINSGFAYVAELDEYMKMMGFDVKYGREVSMEEIEKVGGIIESDFFKRKQVQMKSHDLNTIKFGHPMFVRFKDIDNFGSSITAKTKRFETNYAILHGHSFFSNGSMTEVSAKSDFKDSEVAHANFIKRHRNEDEMIKSFIASVKGFNTADLAEYDNGERITFY